MSKSQRTAWFIAFVLHERIFLMATRGWGWGMDRDSRRGCLIFPFSSVGSRVMSGSTKMIPLITVWSQGGHRLAWFGSYWTNKLRIVMLAKWERKERGVKWGGGGGSVECPKICQITLERQKAWWKPSKYVSAFAVLSWCARFIFYTKSRNHLFWRHIPVNFHPFGQAWIVIIINWIKWSRAQFAYTLVNLLSLKLSTLESKFPSE